MFSHILNICIYNINVQNIFIFSIFLSYKICKESDIFKRSQGQAFSKNCKLKFQVSTSVVLSFTFLGHESVELRSDKKSREWDTMRETMDSWRFTFVIFQPFPSSASNIHTII